MDEALWKAIVNCENHFDGEFYYGVISTRIFCRPSCRSRTPRQENVKIFNSAHEAKDSGFRPCKRCKPDDLRLGPDEEMVNHAIDIINHRFCEKLTLNCLANELCISPYHFHRVFKRNTSQTPTEYIQHIRINKAMDLLKTNCNQSITDIAVEVGFSSLSHFTTVFRRKTGQAPSKYRESNEDIS